MTWIRLVPLAILGAMTACGNSDSASGANGPGGGGDAGGGAAAGSGGSSGGAGADGGSAGSGSGACEPDTERCEAIGGDRPFRVSEHAAVYSEATREMVVFGGTNAVPIQCGFPKADYVAETWLFDDACGKWTQLSVDGPSARGRHMAAYGDEKMWVFGGRYRMTDSTSGVYTLYDDLWSFDVKARTWDEVKLSGERPSARINAGMAFDTKRDRLWLFGGNSSASGAMYSPLNDVWSFDVKAGTWSQHSVADGPSPRLFTSVLYDVERDRLVVYGGGDETAFFPTAKYFADVWALDLEEMSWEVLHDGVTGAPQGRFWGRLVHDTASDRYLLFGGHDDAALGNRNDTWTFDPKAAEWSAVDEGDAYQKPANGVCDFPVDFASVDGALPERRNAHTLVWSTACGRALSFAGKTDCGSTDDVWQFTGSWAKRWDATEGEVCLRWREDTALCSNLCN